MGGTFMSMPEDYRSKFIAQLHNALSGYTGLDVDEAVRYVNLLQLYTSPHPLTTDIPAFPNKANQKQLVSQSKHDQITAFVLTFPKCFDTAAHVSK